MSIYLIKLLGAVGFSFLLTYCLIKVGAWAVLTQITVAILCGILVGCVLLVWMVGVGLDPHWFTFVMLLAVSAPGLLLTRWMDVRPDTLKDD